MRPTFLRAFLIFPILIVSLIISSIPTATSASIITPSPHAAPATPASITTAGIRTTTASARISAPPGTLPATALHPVGRYWLANNELELIGSAVHVGWQFTGTECALYV